MKETNTPILDTKEIITQIKNEVLKRKTKNADLDNQTITHFKVLAKKEFEHKSHYVISDFTQYNDTKFITTLYQILLEREPDPDGFRLYLNQLRSGEFSKTEILAKLRFSKEGRIHNVKVLGIKKRFPLTLLYRIPIIGYIARIIITILTLPKILKRLNHLENYLIITKADKTELEALSNTKADKTELEALSNTKADKTEFEALSAEMAYSKEYMKLTQHNLQILIDGAKKRLKEKTFTSNELMSLIDEEKYQLDAFYVAFEDKFRGSREDIKKRVAVYLPYIEALPFEKKEIEALDVGCGRGEWIELLNDLGYKAEGIDLNRIMVAKSQELGLDVKEADVIEYLRSLQNESLSIITGFHIIEHLPFEVLVSMLNEALRVLKPGGIAIFETPNPENLIVGAYTFYTDPTHINPLVPDTMSFLLERSGFTKVEIKRLHKYSSYADINIDNEFLYNKFANEMDYAVMGYKS